jgi:hypothetical protein
VRSSYRRSARLHRTDLGHRRRVQRLRARGAADLYALAVFTFIRLVESTREEIAYGRAINRIRNYYRELAGERGSLFMMSAHDDARGVLWNMGLGHSRGQLNFTAAMMVAVVNGDEGDGNRRFRVAGHSSAGCSSRPCARR